MSRQKRGNAHPQSIALQRTLIYLAEFQPDIPIPITFLAEVVGSDLMLEGNKNTRMIDNLRRIPALFEASLDDCFSLLTHDPKRATVVVSSRQRPMLKASITALGPDKSWVSANEMGDPLTCLVVELHHGVAAESEEYSPDQLGLLASHGLYWLEQHLQADPNSDNAYAIVQLYDALWLLCDEEAIAPGVLLPFAQLVVEQAERFACEWGEGLPFSFLVSAAEEMAKVDNHFLRQWAERALLCCKHHAEDLPQEERQFVHKVIQVVTKSFNQ